MTIPTHHAELRRNCAHNKPTTTDSHVIAIRQSNYSQRAVEPTHHVMHHLDTVKHYRFTINENIDSSSPPVYLSVGPLQSQDDKHR